MLTFFNNNIIFETFSLPRSHRATGPCSKWECLSALLNLQAVLTVLVTGRVSHVRVVANKMSN